MTLGHLKQNNRLKWEGNPLNYFEISFTYHSLHPFKVYNPMVFSIFTNMCNLITVNFRTFPSLHKEISFPSVTIYQLLHPSGSKQITTFCLYRFPYSAHFIKMRVYVVFCDWLLSFSVIFSRLLWSMYQYFIHSFLWLNNIPLHRYVTYTYPSISCWIFELFLPFGYYK